MNRKRKILLDKINKYLIITGSSSSYDDAEELNAYLGLSVFDKLMDEYDNYEETTYLYKEEMKNDLVDRMN